ncbi:MAG: hypothetical protein KJ604_20340 [Gammaproteobacteria bacterium]|nr:hypothetical protein [Gammaproteobacteria bacterium]
MIEYVSWIQLAITALLLGLIMRSVSKQGQSLTQYLDKEIIRMEKSVNLAHDRISAAAVERKTEYLREDTHQLLCDNAMHELKEHVSKELNALFSALRGLEKKIDRLDGRTGFLRDKEDGNVT